MQKEVKLNMVQHLATVKLQLGTTQHFKYPTTLTPFFLSKHIQWHPAIRSDVLCAGIHLHRVEESSRQQQWHGKLYNSSSKGIIEGKLILHDLE